MVSIALKHLGLFLLLFLIPADLGAAADESVLLTRAETAFRRGQEARSAPEATAAFRDSAKHYQQLYDQGVRNADLLRNLGRAEWLAERWPQAMLAWRLGLLLQPLDEDLRACLEYARDQVQYPPGAAGRLSQSDWPPWLPWPTAARLLGLLLLFHTLACLSLARWRMVGRPGLLFLAGAAFVTVLALLPGFILVQQDEQQKRDSTIVVVAAERLPLRRGNGLSYPTQEEVPPLSRGMEARLLYQRGDWLQIELPGGAVGWIPEAAAVVGKL